MGNAVDRLLSLAASQDGDTPGSTTIPFDVNDVIANVKNLRDGDLLAIDRAVDKEIAGRGLPDPDDN